MFVPQKVHICGVYIQNEYSEKTMSTLVSQNSYHRIKCSQLSMHQTWHVAASAKACMDELCCVHKDQTTSALYNDMHHQPSPLWFRQEIFASGKRHRPCDINRGSPALVVAYANCSIDVCRGLPASVLAFAHHLIHFRAQVVRIGQANSVII